MIKEVFISRNPSHFHINNTVKAFIISESFFWSAWNFITPIFAIFAASNIKGGNVEVAASGYSVFLILRILGELTSGKFFANAKILQKYLVTITGILLVCVSYLGFAFSKSIVEIFIFYAIAGVGFGISGPPKLSLFSTHLDKNKEAYEWGVADSTVFIGMALASALGGFIAHHYGFAFLFIVATIVNLLSIVPYLLYIHQNRNGFFHE